MRKIGLVAALGYIATIFAIAGIEWASNVTVARRQVEFA